MLLLLDSNCRKHVSAYIRMSSPVELCANVLLYKNGHKF